MRIVLLLCAAAIAAIVGFGHIPRAAHHEGFDLVHVDDIVRAPAPRPNRIHVVVVDGLGAMDAMRVPSIAALATRWPCLRADVGPISLSRPGYATLSTGLESDRHGSRNNAESSPMRAQSVWDVLRRAGRTTGVVGENPWWRQLFPAGFDAYELVERRVNVFEIPLTTEVRLLHPMYIDELGHEFGTHSPEYSAGLARLDGELAPYIARVDLSRELLVVTADHGHALGGGHGGRSERLSFVTTCFAGDPVIHEPRRADVSATSVAPAIALLSGVPFPAEMRASSDASDGLSLVLALVDPAKVDARYLEDRRGAVERFRAVNGDRTSRDAAVARRRTMAVVLVSTLILGALLVAARRRPSVALAPLLLLATFGALALVHGSLDLTAVNGTAAWVRTSLLTCTAVATVAITAMIQARSQQVAREAVTASSFLGTLGFFVYLAIHGAHLAPPLPSATVIFLPVVLSTIVLIHAIFGVALEVACAVRRP